MYTYKYTYTLQVISDTSTKPLTTELSADTLVELLFLMYVDKVLTKEQFEEYKKDCITLR